MRVSFLNKKDFLAWWPIQCLYGIVNIEGLILIGNKILNEERMIMNLNRCFSEFLQEYPVLQKCRC